MTLPTPLRGQIRAVAQAASATELLQSTQALAGRLAEVADAPPEASELEDAIATLVQVLGFNNPGAAVAAVDGLIALGSPAVEPLLSRLDPRNYGARAWAVRALAGIGDVRGLELLEEALATDVGPSVRRAAACGLGNLRLDPLSEAERPAIRSRSLQALLAGREDGEWVVRYAVAVGLEALVLGMEPLPHEQDQALEVLEALAEAEREEAPVVRLRASMALERLRNSPTSP
ncbi:MAG: HEAT repeat domain-containing protein [Cyanobium sp.]